MIKLIDIIKWLALFYALSVVVLLQVQARDHSPKSSFLIVSSQVYAALASIAASNLCSLLVSLFCS